jgi:hypothetical protein
VPGLWPSLGDNELGFRGMPPPGARGLAYIALLEAPQPSDQTDHDLRLLLILKSGGGMIQKVEPNWLYRWGARPYPWVATRLPGRISLPFGLEPSRTF